MADFKSSLPIVTLDQDGADLIGQIADGGGSGNKAEVDANNDLHVLAKITDSDGGDINGANPLPVTFKAGTCTDDYDTAAAVASMGTSDHDFAPGVAGDVVGLVLSSSGCAKWELQVGAAASEVTKAVWFTSAAEQSRTVSLPCGLGVGATDNIKLVRTNRDEQAMDVYSTILFEAN